MTPQQCSAELAPQTARSCRRLQLARLEQQPVRAARVVLVASHVDRALRANDAGRRPAATIRFIVKLPSGDLRSPHESSPPCGVPQPHIRSAASLTRGDVVIPSQGSKLGKGFVPQRPGDNGGARTTVFAVAQAPPSRAVLSQTATDRQPVLCIRKGTSLSVRGRAAVGGVVRGRSAAGVAVVAGSAARRSLRSSAR